MAKPENPVQMAVIGAPHGVQGEVRVKTFTGDSEALGDYGPLYGPDGRPFEVAKVRPAGNVLVVRFAGITNREAAAALTGLPLFVDRSALPDDLDEEEFYHADLIGLVVGDASGETLGRITAVHDFGGGDILEVALTDGRSVMVPFSRAAVPEIDVRARFARIDPAAAGLDATEDTTSPGGEGEEDHSFNPVKRARGPRAAGGNR